MSTELAKNDSLKSLINSDKVREQIERALPKHCNAERFLRVATTMLLKVPKLASCSKESFMKAMLDCSSLGLEPDGRLCHLIPFKDQVQLIIDYKGLIELAKRSGEVASWKAETVKEKDFFEWENGVIQHKIDWRNDRGGLQCVYSIARLSNGEIDTEVMTLAEVESIRKRSRAGDSGPWVTDFEEMAKKTVIKRHSKRLRLSPEFMTAIEKDYDGLDDFRGASVRVDRKIPFSLQSKQNDDVATDVESEIIEDDPAITRLFSLMESNSVAEKEILKAASVFQIGNGKKPLAQWDEKDVAMLIEKFDDVLIEINESKGGAE